MGKPQDASSFFSLFLGLLQLGGLGKLVLLESCLDHSALGRVAGAIEEQPDRAFVKALLADELSFQRNVSSILETVSMYKLYRQ